VLSCEIVDKSLLISLEGELDMHTAPPFKETIDAELQKNPNLINLVLIMSNVSFIDSSGLGAILGRYRIIEERGGKLTIVAPTPHVMRVLKLSGMERIASFKNSAAEALQE